MTDAEALERYRAELTKAGSLPAEEREAAERAALARLNVAIAGEHVHRGGLAFLRVDMERILDEERRGKDVLGRRKGAGQVLSSRRILLLITCGYSAAILRTGGMSREKANTVVSRWTGGAVSPVLVTKWTPAFGRVRADGAEIAKEPEVRDAVGKLFRSGMPEERLKALVQRAARDNAG